MGGWRLQRRPAPRSIRKLLFTWGLATTALGAQAGLLSELWRLAMEADPAVTGAAAQLRAAEERFVQAKSAFGPNVGVTLNYGDTRYDEAPTYDGRKFWNEAGTIQLTQPLFRTALVFGYQSAQAQYEQARLAVIQAGNEVAARLVEASFDVLKARDAVRFVSAQQVAADEQLAAARRSFTVGKAPVTDVRDAEAKVDTVAAQWLAAQADLELKQQLLLELVGRPVPELLSRGLAGDSLPALDPSGVLPWLADAQTQSPQIGQAKLALDAAEAETTKAVHAHVPTADLTINHTVSKDTGTVTSIFPRSGRSTTLGVTVNIPLFASGATESKVREVTAQRDKARSDLDAARRSVQIGVRQNFTAAQSSIALVGGLETAKRSLELSLKANRRGYEVGLRVNSEVLEAQSKVFEAQRDLSKARYDAWLYYTRLKAFAGTLIATDIDQLDRLLVTVEELPMRGRGPSKAAKP